MEKGFGELQPSQWEVTYVNYIPRGTVWSTLEEWTTVFRSWPCPAIVPEGKKLEGFGMHWHFEIDPQRGRLHVEVEHAYVGREEKKEVLVMKLTARGPVTKDKAIANAVDEGLNLGHDVIVTSFEALTSPRAHEYWNRESDNGS